KEYEIIVKLSFLDTYQNPTYLTSPAPCNNFFFYSYGDHRDLHSFPTRRSSDSRHSSSLSASRCARARPARRRRPACAGSRAPMGDRKSTRLNSSHVAISYAVFCLKKKKKNISGRGLMELLT